jgi:hypothetical protein
MGDVGELIKVTFLSMSSMPVRWMTSHFFPFFEIDRIGRLVIGEH